MSEFLFIGLGAVTIMIVSLYSASLKNNSQKRLIYTIRLATFISSEFSVLQSGTPLIKIINFIKEYIGVDKLSDRQLNNTIFYINVIRETRDEYLITNDINKLADCRGYIKTLSDELNLNFDDQYQNYLNSTPH